MNALEIKYVPISSLVPYSRNPRKWDKSNAVQKMVSSIKEFGFTIPVLVKPDLTIIDGHLRYAGAKKLDMAEIPVVIADGWTEAQVKAFRLLANRSVNWAEWDDELLRLELEELQSLDFNLELTGFDTSDLERLLESESTGDDGQETVEEGPTPEPPVQPVTRAGDLWQLGRHRLLCGDSTDPEVVWKALDGQKAALCFTSPPYQYKRDYQNAINDWDALMVKAFSNVLAVMVDDGQVLVNLGMSYDNTEWQPYWDSWIEGLRAKGWRRYGLYVWDQGPGLPGNCNGVGRFAASFELIFHFNQQSRTPNKIIPCLNAGTLSKHAVRKADGSFSGKETPIQDFKIPDNVIRVTRQKGSIGDCGDHPAVFPVALPELIINTFTQPGEVVLEPFCGSGTQFLAAENAGRSCAGIELAPAYVDVAIARWKQETGQEAILAETGEPFSVVQQRRVGG